MDPESQDAHVRTQESNLRAPPMDLYVHKNQERWGQALKVNYKSIREYIDALTYFDNSLTFSILS